jgi:hypothetical protein
MALAASVVITSLGFVFLLAAIGKMRHPLVFADVVRNYEILPSALAPWVAFLLIAIESFLAAAFFTGWLIEVAIPAAAATLLGFAAAVAVNLRRNRSVACGCFGDPQERISPSTITRLALLLLGVLFICMMNVGQGAADEITVVAARDVRYGLEAATLAVAANLLAMWLLALPELMSIMRKNTEVDLRQSKLSTGHLGGEGESRWT